MKSLLFKQAWNLVKIQGMSFSDALKTSWKCYKSQVKIIVTESWNKIKRIAYSKNGTQSSTIENVINSEKSIVNNDGCALYYNYKNFNND